MAGITCSFAIRLMIDRPLSTLLTGDDESLFSKSLTEDSKIREQAFSIDKEPRKANGSIFLVRKRRLEVLESGNFRQDNKL